jgi:peptide deformylase
MALLEILKFPDPFLQTKVGPVDKVNDEIRTIIDEMVETMYHNRGIGLAAVQVGVDKRIIVLDVPDNIDDEEGPPYERGKNLIAVVNPEITEATGTIKYEEGCLSVPGVSADVIRAEKVRLKGLDREGNPIELDAEGLFAIALQHEIDHIDGKLFIERLSRLKRDLIKRRLLKAHEAQRAL